MKNPKRINYAIDYHPEAARNATAAEGLAAIYDSVEEINNALGTVADPRALSKAVAQRSAAAIRRHLGRHYRKWRAAMALATCCAAHSG